MTLRDVETDLDRAGVTRIIRRTAPVNLTQAPRPAARREDSLDALTLLPERWTWKSLRDYVVRQIELRHGPWQRNPLQETGIFKRFHAAWGAEGVRIARYVFEHLDGYWRGEPVTITLFCKGSDRYFAHVIHERLTD